MGYTTDFEGSFKLSQPLSNEKIEYINKFADSRRMKRDVHKLMELYNRKHGHPTPKSNTPKHIYGKDGAYFNVEEDNYYGDNKDSSVIDYNTPPGQIPYDDPKYTSNERWEENKRRVKDGECQPGLWCQWVLDEEGTELHWDGNEKFYEYIPWVKYLIKHFFEPWGIKLNGEVEWFGEDPDDRGKIIIIDNVVQEKIGRIVYD